MKLTTKICDFNKILKLTLKNGKQHRKLLMTF